MATKRIKLQFDNFGDKTVNGTVIRTYRVLLNDNPVDQFQLWWSSTSEWVAWTGDTLNSDKRRWRKAFAVRLNSLYPSIDGVIRRCPDGV